MNTNSISAPTARLAILDALRAIAVILVLGRHLPTSFGLSGPIAGALLFWQSFGWMGVDLFFVLSGFLVSGLLFTEHQRHGSTRALRFLGRRGSKIYPGFYLLFLVGVLWSGGRLGAQVYLSEAFFLQNYVARVWPHTWSLAVEEHFYLLLAAAVTLAQWLRPGPNTFRGLPRLGALICVAVLSCRTLQWFQHPTTYLLLPTHLRLDGLTFGVMLSYAWHHHHARTLEWVTHYRRPLLIGGAALLLPCVLLRLENGTVVNTIGLTLNYLGFGAILLATLATDPIARPRWVRWLAPIGVHSYSIYLWQMPVSRLVKRWVEPRIGEGAGIALYLVGSVAVGVLLAKLIELPFLRLRDRWLPSRALLAPIVLPAPPAVAG